MTKVGEIVSAALRKSRVIDPDQNPEPRQYQTAIEEMNRMLSRWEADTLSLGWVRVNSPDEDFPLPERAELAVILNLAVALRPEYGASLDPDLYESAREQKSALWADLTRESYDRLSYDLPASDSYYDRLGFFAGN